MMKSMIVSLTLGLGIGMAMGQGTVAPTGGNSDPRATGGAHEESKSKFRVTTLGDWKGPELAILTQERAQGSRQFVRIPIEMASMAYSSEYPFKKGQAIVIIEKDSPEDHPKVVMQTMVPTDCKTPLLLMVPNQEQLQHRWIDTDPSVFPYGAIHVVNYTQQPLGIVCGKEGHKVEKGEIAKLSAVSGEASMPAELLSVGNPSNGEFFFKSMIIRRPSKRMLVFFMANPENPKGVPCNRMLVDFKPT